MQKTNVRYWLCQLIGWGGWTLLSLFSAFQFANEMFNTDKKRSIFFTVLIIEFIWSILVTHLLRMVLKRMNWIKFPLDKVVVMFIIGVASVGLIEYNEIGRAHV